MGKILTQCKINAPLIAVTQPEQSDGFLTLSSTALRLEAGRGGGEGRPSPCAVEDGEMASAGEGQGFPILSLADNHFSATLRYFQHTNRHFYHLNYLKVSKIQSELCGS